MTTRKSSLVLPLSVSAIVSLACVATAHADSCVGTCGTLGPNGVVTAPPGGSNYEYVSTSNGVIGAGEIASVGGTNGSLYTSNAFSATAGQALTFNFNYVTSDGSQFSDYAFAELVKAGTTDEVAYLFTARTEPTGNTSPGLGLPADGSVLTPATSAIIGGAPTWSPLGASSGTCFDVGCGYTGWIGATYDVANAGSYQVLFGVTNWLDEAFDSGLAFNGLSIGGVGVGGGAGGGTTSAPEIDPFSASAGLTLLAGWLAVLRGRRKTPKHI